MTLVLCIIIEEDLLIILYQIFIYVFIKSNTINNNQQKCVKNALEHWICKQILIASSHRVLDEKVVDYKISLWANCLELRDTEY